MAPKAKSKHATNALSKAVKTNRHTTPTSNASGKIVMDARTAAATPHDFSLENVGTGVGARAPTKNTSKTVLTGESYINVERRIRNASVPIGGVIEDDANVVEELSIEGFDLTGFAKRLMPRRPAWSFEVSSGRLHFRESEAFKRWLTEVQELIMERGGYPPAFEQNLQVWRQLWRVLERCDVAVLVVDVRHPLLHLPPALVHHVRRTLRKPLVMVLNKLDAVAPKDALGWAEQLRRAIPGVAGIVGHSKDSLKESDFEGLPLGKAALIEACHAAHAAWRLAAHEEGQEEVPARQPAETPEEEGRLMLGFVGHPNVGKSSLINSLMGEKVVSVKATPGHTKTLQTIALDERTCFCDSPGLVFPRLNVPRESQIVGMLIPVAQVREPFSALRWVMEHSIQPLPDALGLKGVSLQQVLDWHSNGVDVLRLDGTLDEGEGPVPWSPMLLCAQYASQRGLVKAGRPDCIAAGTEILQRVLDGRVPYRVKPPEPDCALPEAGEESSGSDWEVDDEDYESEEEAGEKAETLFDVLGIEPKGPGSGSIRSRKKQAKRKIKEELASKEREPLPAKIPEEQQA